MEDLDYILYNNEPNIENNDNFEDDSNSGEKLTAIFILIISLILMAMNILSLYYSYDYLVYASHRYTYEVFDKCVKYQSITEIFFTLFALLASISVSIMSIGITIQYELFFDKFFYTFLNFNYYIFGLLLFMSSALGLLKYNNICYDCIRKNPNRYEFNLSTFICLIMIATIGGTITFIFSSLNGFEYVCNCIKYTKDGHHILGKAFWKYVLSRNNQPQHERNE